MADESVPVTTPRLRGAKPTPRHILMRATPYVQREPHPDKYANVPARLSMWGNSQYGDCVTAEEAFAKIADLPNVFISDQTVISWASSHGFLNGAYLEEVLQAMARDGIQAEDGKVYKDGKPTTVDWTDRDILCNAIYAGPVKIAVAADQLENVVGSKSGWFGGNFGNDDNIDHCVALASYGPLQFLFDALNVNLPSGADPSAFGYHLFTWNTIGVVTEKSMRAITAEAWKRTPTTAGFPDPTPTPPVPPVPPVPPSPPVPPMHEFCQYPGAEAPVTLFGIPLGTAHVPAVHMDVQSHADGSVPRPVGFSLADLWKIAQHALAIWSAIKSDQALKDAINALLADFGIPPILTMQRLDMVTAGAAVNYWVIAADVLAIVQAVRTYGPMSAQTIAAVQKLLADIGLTVV